LRVDIENNLPAATLDADALEQAILNLLSNAMKYSGSGRTIDLRLSRETGNAVIAVTDRGCGIAVAEQGRIFEKFYRMSEHQTIAGTGLGLTLVDHTARAHAGRVDVRSAPGEGSTFSIVLPLESQNT
jgi:two-component system, OmpR family, phosphate regulon sensor histidine kinase PhoR